MKSKELTIPTTIEDLEKMVRRMIGEAMQSTADFCRALDDVPSTEDKFLDEALDALHPAAQAAIVALLARHGQDDRIDAARARLRARVSQFDDPDVLRELCADADDADGEESVRYWLAFGSSAI
jgi:hypothetical protein